jgi:Asp-tRNA(Asn)/Glu-tRNA(Gln) amidotransferase C subunit
MSDQPIRRRKSNNEEVSQMMDEILGALDHIRTHMPNGELKIIQEKVEAIEESHEKLHDDISQIKKLLLDPETGVVVRVNKNTQFREDNEKSMREKFEVLNEVNKWKDGINKAMWIIFAALIGIIFELFFKK